MAWPADSARTKTWATEVFTASDQQTQLDILHTYNKDQLNGTTGHGHTGGTNDGKPIVLTTAVTGILPVANGGTGSATASTVNLTGDQTVAGIKTFSSAIVSNLTGNVTGNLTGSAIAQMGTWAARSINTNYQESTDGFVVFAGDVDNGDNFQILTDSATPPTTMRQRVSTASGTTAFFGSMFCPVKKNDYWKLSVVSGTCSSPTLYFLPTGG